MPDTVHAPLKFAPPPERLAIGEDKGAQSERAYAAIRRRILLGELPPGEKLRVETLQRDLSLSSTPVREALNRLTSERLVSFEENRGFRTAPLLASDLRDIIRLRIVVETDALRDAIRHGDDAWEAGIVSANYRLTQYEKRSRVGGEEWTALHKAFHLSLLAACTYPRLLAMCDQLFDETERYRRVAVRVGLPKRDVGAEHERMMQAVLQRDPVEAARLVTEHIHGTADRVASSLGG
jgi:GntR family carbon starvation induced transcriptional regulator